ncbi:hypothetical protein P7K49_019438, partial [Saguinus oedipus]
VEGRLGIPGAGRGSWGPRPVLFPPGQPPQGPCRSRLRVPGAAVGRAGVGACGALRGRSGE